MEGGLTRVSSTTQMSRGSTIAAMIAACLAVAAVAVFSTAFAESSRGGSPAPGGADQPAAAAEPTTSDDTVDHTQGPADPADLSEPEVLEEGEAAADDEAADATTAIEPTAGRTPAGAVEAFVSYATWVIASPAAAEEPFNSSEALGGELNAGDAALVEAIDHTNDLDFEPSKGAYRLLGHSGDGNAPEQVMLEVVAPMTVNGQIKWSKVSGVVVWKDGRWRPTSMQPGEVVQPGDPTLALADLPETDRDLLLEGLGWELFSNAGSDG